MDDSWSTDGDDLNSPPTFRPFTREELEVIEKRIFEKKLAAKKQEEKLAKNIKVSQTEIPELKQKGEIRGGVL